ncbi:unnamed protein product [Lathyrus sativus]|nr:unnamed protein product [Lathyrus sativus]
MDKWKSIQFSKEEEEGIKAEVEEVCEGEILQRTLAGKQWTNNSFNSRAFISTMTGTWKLRNPVEVQDLNKNLFLFRLATKRDLKCVLKNGPWSFDKYILILSCIFGEEQPFEHALWDFMGANLRASSYASLRSHGKKIGRHLRRI